MPGLKARVLPRVCYLRRGFRSGRVDEILAVFAMDLVGLDQRG